jgi:hypothetical protein
VLRQFIRRGKAELPGKVCHLAFGRRKLLLALVDRYGSTLKALPRVSGLDKTGASAALGSMCGGCISQANTKISQKDYASRKGLSNDIVDVMAVAETLGAEETFVGSR